MRAKKGMDMVVSSKPASNAPVLRVQGLGFGFAGHGLFKDWSADFPAGLSLVLGGDGSGKTSLLRLLAGDCVPQAGRVLLRGMDLMEQGSAYRAQVFWRDPRAPWPEMLAPQAWVEDISARHARWSDEDWSTHTLGFGLAQHLHKPMYQLSAGSQRKVLLAAALASGAALTLLDEPVATLDKASIAYLLQALEQEARAPRSPGRAVIVAHYEELGDLPWSHTVTL